MKTNAMRILDSKNIKYTLRDYSKTNLVRGTDVAKFLKEDPNQVFKTLVTISKDMKYYVFIIPVNKELNLKQAATFLNVKSIDLILQKDLLNLTGYIHGGCSPFGMKKQFETYIDSSVLALETIMVSAGKIGYQLELMVSDILNNFSFKTMNLVK